MKWLTIDMIRQRLRIDDIAEEDALLEQIASGAEKRLLGDIDRTYDELIMDYGEIPQDIIDATLLLVDASYQQRSAVAQMQWSVVPYAYDHTVKKYMRLADRRGDEYDGAVTVGSQLKLLVDACLPDGLTMDDVGFSVTVYNADHPDRRHDYEKDGSGCQRTLTGQYCVLVDTEEIGVGRYMMMATFEIPDQDYPDGHRRERIRINPDVRVYGSPV